VGASSLGQMSASLEHKGGKYYHRSEHEGRLTTYSKASIGEFIFEVIAHGGEIIQIWPFNPSYKRSAMYYVVAMTPEQRDVFCEKTGYVLADPPRVQVGMSWSGSKSNAD
jgi:hypothetical protein